MKLFIGIGTAVIALLCLAVGLGIWVNVQHKKAAETKRQEWVAFERDMQSRREARDAILAESQRGTEAILAQAEAIEDIDERREFLEKQLKKAKEDLVIAAKKKELEEARERLRVARESAKARIEKRSR